MFLHPSRLPESVKDYIADDAEREFYLSHASGWEISIKYGTKKLSLPANPDVFVPSRVASAGFLHLPIELHHVLSVFELPKIHKDPFDRLLISQARAEDMTILTVDEKIAAYKVKTKYFANLN